MQNTLVFPTYTPDQRGAAARRVARTRPSRFRSHRLTVYSVIARSEHSLCRIYCTKYKFSSTHTAVRRLDTNRSVVRTWSPRVFLHRWLNI